MGCGRQDLQRKQDIVSLHVELTGSNPLHGLRPLRVRGTNTAYRMWMRGTNTGVSHVDARYYLSVSHVDARY
eukprot:2222565-Rhodomonas_salina.1